MNLLRNGLLMRKTGDRRRTELTEESASQCGFSAEFITRSRNRHLSFRESRTPEAGFPRISNTGCKWVSEKTLLLGNSVNRGNRCYPTRFAILTESLSYHNATTTPCLSLSLPVS